MRAPHALGILPVGAACKEHGEHLPLDADAVQARWAAEEVAGRHRSLVWPLVAYGFYPAFVRYPGSASIDEETFEATLVAILDAMTRAGHPRRLVLNTGISTMGAVDRACRRGNALACHVYAGRRFLEARKRLCGQAGGGHADEAETSLMLHIAPSFVVLARATDASATPQGPGPLNPDRPGEANYSPSGATGNPTLALAETGRALAGAMIEDILELLAN